MTIAPEELYWRQLDVFDPRKYESRVTLIGCGGIGSAVGLCLAKMGIQELELWDGDTVENHNFPNQLYPVTAYRNGADAPSSPPSEQSNVGVSKAEVMFDFLGTMAPDTHMHVHAQMWEGEPLRGIVVCGVDSMAVRQKVWDAVKANPLLCKLYIDGRMGAQNGMVYCVNPSDAKEVSSYEKTLYTDAEASEARCTERAIMYNVFVLAGIVGRQVRAYLTGNHVNFGEVFDLDAMGFMTLEVKK